MSPTDAHHQDEHQHEHERASPRVVQRAFRDARGCKRVGALQARHSALQHHCRLLSSRNALRLGVSRRLVGREAMRRLV
jgi:hypothetical protein